MPTSLPFGRAACTPQKGSAAALVEVLEQVVGGQLDLLVAPFGGPVLAGDQAHAVEAAEVAVDEGVAGLGVVAGPVGEGQVPVGVLLPGVGLQEAFSSSALGWTSVQTLFSTYWRASMSWRARATACWLTV
jgi:hypothetical protein